MSQSHSRRSIIIWGNCRKNSDKNTAGQKQASEDPPRPPPTALRVALGSGALRGAYQYGFFKELDALDAGHDRIVYDKVHGSSIGALNAPFIAAKRTAMMAPMWEAEDPFAAAMIKERVLHTAIDEAAHFLFGRRLSRREDCLALLLLRGHWFAGFDDQAIRSVWDSAGDSNMAQALRDIEVLCVTFNVTTHRETWLRVHNIDEYLNATKRSAALPGFLPPFIDANSGNWFIDGGIIEYVPLSRLCEPSEFDGIYVIFDNHTDDERAAVLAGQANGGPLSPIDSIDDDDSGSLREGQDLMYVLSSLERYSSKNDSTKNDSTKNDSTKNDSPKTCVSNCTARVKCGESKENRESKEVCGSRPEDAMRGQRAIVFRPDPLQPDASIFGTKRDVQAWITQGSKDARIFYAKHIAQTF